MKVKSLRLIVLITSALGALSFLGLSSCSSTQNASAGMTKGEKVNTYQSLIDYLRRDPKVQIVGSGDNAAISIRGVSNIDGPHEPLFVLDGTPIGNSYSQAAHMVDVNNISTVRVKAPAEANGQYGQRGEHGVIEIRTKAANK